VKVDSTSAHLVHNYFLSCSYMLIDITSPSSTFLYVLAVFALVATSELVSISQSTNDNSQYGRLHIYRTCYHCPFRPLYRSPGQPRSLHWRYSPHLRRVYYCERWSPFRTRGKYCMCELRLKPRLTLGKNVVAEVGDLIEFHYLPKVSSYNKT
jgi:hypothetical protein